MLIWMVLIEFGAWKMSCKSKEEPVFIYLGLVADLSFDESRMNYC
jgi:hypothetical protein